MINASEPNATLDSLSLPLCMHLLSLLLTAYELVHRYRITAGRNPLSPFRLIETIVYIDGLT